MNYKKIFWGAAASVFVLAGTYGCQQRTEVSVAVQNEADKFARSERARTFYDGAQLASAALDSEIIDLRYGSMQNPVAGTIYKRLDLQPAENFSANAQGICFVAVASAVSFLMPVTSESVIGCNSDPKLKDRLDIIMERRAEAAGHLLG